MDQSYAPRSPELSGYAPRSPDLTAYRPASPQGQGLYAPQSPDLSGLQQPQQHYVQQAPVHSSFGGLEQNQQQLLHQQHIPQTYPPQQSGYTLAQHPLQQPSQSFQSDPYQQLGFGQQLAYQQQYPAYPEMPAQTRNRGVRTPAEVGSYNYDNANVKEEEPAWEQHPQPITQAATPARRGRKPKSENANGAAPPTPMKKMDTGGIEVKTKFPTARIKRIMQADEDVGKVAQVTPVVMAKALELFMIRLISASAANAKQRGSKRVLSQHMKSAVMQDEQFDNLRDIVGRVPDAPAKGANGDDSEDEDSAPKKGAGRGRKTGAGAGAGRGKKRRDSDDF
ncbi:histone-fold-containing protein [Aureobasidium sp. EXF-8846]|nr:histone-fold-containing protein [Aureobasidium sp. EXF-8846]